MTSQDAAKRAVGETAAALVEDGMLVGLGTGSTARFLVDALAERMRNGLRFRGVPTSVATQQQALACGIPLVELGDVPGLDLAIDGADEVLWGTLDLIKGLGGALLREKIIAQGAGRFVVIADASKMVDRLGTLAPLPVETAHFAHKAVARRLPGKPVLREGKDGEAFVTDNGNLIYDCHDLPAVDPGALALELDRIAGVVGHGLFLGMTEQAIIGSPDGTVQVLRPA